MKKIAILFLLYFNFSAQAENPRPILGEAETIWPGIHFQVFNVVSIPDGRLLIGVRVAAAADAPKRGTLIGKDVPIPANASASDIEQGLYNPVPFSLESAIMIDEKTKLQYSALAPKPSENYLSGVLLCSLRPLQAETMAVQFMAPPPEFDEKGKPIKQTVSIMIPNAKAPITKIPIPLPPFVGR